MRSYRAHLETLLNSQSRPLARRPNFRSSAIFPVLVSEGIGCRLLFLSYWALKREIQTVTLVATLRDASGTSLYRRVEPICEPRAYRLELAEMIPAGQAHFTGSIEVEFFSGQDLVFPYPAVVINYYGEHFSTVVHTAQRIYNDHEDWHTNDQTVVLEAGFNLYACADKEPFVAFVNGPEPVPAQTVALLVYNRAQQELRMDLPIEALRPCETKVLYPAQHADLVQFLGGEVGTAKIGLQVAWIYPRLLVGNVQHAIPSMSITHTYYDCTAADREDDYWFADDPGWHDASLMVPVKIEGASFTNVYFYPIYSPSEIDIDVEIYDCRGRRLGICERVVKMVSQGASFAPIEMKTICAKLGLEAAGTLTARVLAHRAPGSLFPSRIKLGLDVGQSNGSFPCNICTNLNPFNPALEAKPHCFRWLPVFPEGSVWLINSSPARSYSRAATVQVAFFRECDTTKLERTITLAPHGFLVIEVVQDAQLTAFLQNSTGWCTAISTNPYLSTYYFIENLPGAVGGDHGF